MRGICGAFGKQKKLETEALRISGLAGDSDGEVFKTVTSEDAAVLLYVENPAAFGEGCSWQTDTLFLLWDGFLSNQEEICRHLRMQGICESISSQAEAVAWLYQCYGRRCVDFMQGAFVLMLYDKKKQELYVWRDRLGIRPCVYTKQEDRVMIASTVGLLEQLQGTRLTLDADSIAWPWYFMMHAPAPNATVYTGVWELEPGHMLEVTARGMLCRQYAAAWGTGLDGLCREDTVAALDVSMHQAVSACLTAEPVGVLLSGGLDSAYLAAVAAQHVEKPVETYTLQFICEHPAYAPADGRLARDVAEQLHTAHTTYFVTGDEALQSLPKIAAAFDAPYSGGVSLYWLLERVPADRRLFLTGDGADEAFWGYPYHLQILQQIEKPGGSDRIRAPLPHMDWELWNLLLKEKPEWRDIKKRLTLSGTRADCEKLVNQYFYQVMLPGQVFRYQDVFSRVWGKEIRCPYTQQGIVEQMWCLSAAEKMRGGDAKHLLKQMAAAYLPVEIRNRKKETFLPPIASWMQVEWKECVLDLLSMERLNRTGHFHGEMVYYLLKQFYEGAESPGLSEYIWSIFMYELWFIVKNIK